MKDANLDDNVGNIIEETSLGEINVHTNVTASIVRKAVCTVPGVARLAGSSFVDNIAEMVGNRRIHDRAIKIVDNGDSLDIEVNINIFYGIPIPDVAVNVQESVIEAVEKTAGKTVKAVNVVIQEIEDEVDEEEEETSTTSEIMD